MARGRMLRTVVAGKEGLNGLGDMNGVDGFGWRIRDEWRGKYEPFRRGRYEVIRTLERRGIGNLGHENREKGELWASCGDEWWKY